jgi:UPF0755 protein
MKSLPKKMLKPNRLLFFGAFVYNRVTEFEVIRMRHLILIVHKRVLTIAVIVLCFIGIAWYGIVHSQTAASLPGGEPRLISVKLGMNVGQIGDILHQSGIIDNVTLFRLMAKLEGMDNSLQAGDYSFTPGMGVRQVLFILARGETAYRQLTVPEGYTIDQIATLLEEKHLGSATRFKVAAQKIKAYDYMAPDGKTTYSA